MFCGIPHYVAGQTKKRNTLQAPNIAIVSETATADRCRRLKCYEKRIQKELLGWMRRWQGRLQASANITAVLVDGPDVELREYAPTEEVEDQTRGGPDRTTWGQRQTNEYARVYGTNADKGSDYPKHFNLLVRQYASQLKAAFESMTQKQKQVAGYYFVEGQRQQEIGDRLAMEQADVSNVLKRIRLAFLKAGIPEGALATIFPSHKAG